jgi:SnoaL-like domain
MDPEFEAQLRELVDKQAIHDRLMRYARGIDRNDGELVAETFWPDALVDHGHSKFSGENIADFFSDVSTHATTNQVHYIMNLLIEVTGDEAVSEGQAWYLAETERNDVPYLISRSIRYIDRWAKRNGEWRVFHRTVPETWNEMHQIVERVPQPQGLILGISGKNDISYTLFEQGRQHDRPPLDKPDNTENWKHARERLDPGGFVMPKHARQ